MTLGTPSLAQRFAHVRGHRYVGRLLELRLREAVGERAHGVGGQLEPHGPGGGRTP